MDEFRPDESRGDPLVQIVNELPSPQSGFASRELQKVRSWERSSAERRMAKEAIIKYAEDYKLERLADAAKSVAIPGTREV